MRTGIAKHHGRYSKSDHLCQDGEEWTSRRKRLRRRIFVKYAVEISDLPLFSSRDVCKNKAYRIIGGKQCHSVNKCILFEITRMQSVNRRIAALFYASVMKVLKARPGVRRKKWFHRQISATRTTRYYDDFFIISKTNLNFSESALRGFRSLLAPCLHFLFVLPSVFITREVNEK